MTVEPDGGIEITYLPEMLEGQVAVLSAGQLSAKESIDRARALKASALYRPDQHSYMLYPNRPSRASSTRTTWRRPTKQGSKLFHAMVEAGNRDIVTRDCDGGFHFHGNFNKGMALRRCPAALPARAQPLVERRAGAVEARSTRASSTTRPSPAAPARSSATRASAASTGTWCRSCAWPRLKSYEAAVAQSEPAEVVGRLAEITSSQRGHRRAQESGRLRCLPDRSRTRTPRAAGAQQPGMTGQVKEDLLCRFGELGVRVSAVNSTSTAPS